MIRNQNFVEFYSPGTFVSESTESPIETWDIPTACRMAGEVKERYDAKPYAFRFTSATVSDPIDDGKGGKLKVVPKESARSGLHHLGGIVLSYDDVKARNDDKNSILLSNMRCKEMWFVCENRNSWLSTTAFGESDVVVNPKSGEIVERGNSPERSAYRQKMTAERNAEYAGAK